MPTLTNNEMTAFLNNDAVARAEARTLTNISRRALTLFTDGGYQCRQQTESGFVVESPAGDKYLVWHGLETGYSCSCPCFAKLTTCKHLEAVDMMKRDAADSQKADREYEEAEEARNFFDSRYEMDYD